MVEQFTEKMFQYVEIILFFTKLSEYFYWDWYTFQHTYVFWCIYTVLNLKTKVSLFLSKTLPATPMSGDVHSLAVSGSNQRLQDFNSVLQSKLVRSFPAFECNREYQLACFLFLFSSIKQLSKKDWFWITYLSMDCWCWFFHLCHEKLHYKR